jgi:hypothetical protein
MVHSDEIYMEMRESEHIDSEERMKDYVESGKFEAQQYDGEVSQLHHLVPPIDLALMEPSMATSEQIANGIIEAIKEGRISPLEFAVKKKCIEQALEAAFKDEEIKDMTITEIEKYGKAGASCMGATLTVKSIRKYEYEADPKWKELNEGIKWTKDLIKAQVID